MSDFSFLNPEWLLAIVPVSLFLLWLSRRARKQTLIAPHLAHAMGIKQTQFNSSKLGAISFVYAIAIIALAGPSIDDADKPTFSSTNARVLVMDMSRSMYANDIKPNRLTQARYKAMDLLSLWQEGSTGLIVYAGSAYTISPMTSDTNTIINLIPNLSPELMPYPGADAASGVKAAIEMMTNTGLTQGTIVLIADDIDSNEKNDIASLLKGTPWQLEILAVGSRAGAPITNNDGSLMTSNSGKTVIAKTDLSTMRSLAKQVGGEFTAISVTNADVESIAQRTDDTRSTSALNTSQRIKEKRNIGYWFLPLLVVPALLLFRRGVLFVVLVSAYPLMSPNTVYANPWLTDDQAAIKLYNANEFEAAQALFNDTKWKGIAAYQANDFEQAIKWLKEDSSVNGNYNLANAYAQSQQFDKAIELYDRVLEQQPDHADALYNKDLVLQQQQQQQQQQQDDSGDQSSNGDRQNNQTEPSSNSKASDSKASDSKTSDSNSSEKQNQERDSESTSNSESGSQSDSQPENTQQQPSQNKDERTSKNEQQEARSEESNTQADAGKKSARKMTDEQNSANAKTAQPDNQKDIDPAIRKLEQVESARDPSRLLQAQILLQAQQQTPPQETGKKW